MQAPPPADAANLAPDELRFVQEVENELFARWWERAKFMMAFLPVGGVGREWIQS